MADRIVLGWRYAPVRDDKKLPHDMILPYSALSKEGREKDRDAYGAPAAASEGE